MTLRAAVAVILRDGRCFQQRRHPASRIMPGLWEFPGGKIEAGETPLEALLRELREELDWVPAAAQSLPPFRQATPEFVAELHPFRCEGPGAFSTPLAWGWFLPQEIRRLPVPAATGRILDLLGWP